MTDQTKILHIIEIFQGKFELMCQSTYGIKFKVSKASSDSSPSKPLVDGQASIGPITIDKISRPAQNLVADEEDEVQMDREKT